MKQTTEEYDSDRAITSSADDRFGRHKFSQRVAHVILERRDPSSIVVGIYGPWGEGKTSVLNMVIEELDKHPERVFVRRFNPWRFAGEEQLLINFFTLLADLLQKSLKTKGEQAAEQARKYAGALSVASFWGFSAKEAVEGLASLKAVPDLDELKNRLDEWLKKSDVRLVIVMDDIDRLDRDEIQAVLKLVKLTGDFSNTAYILAFDEQMVGQALAHKYGTPEAGRNFLEKIIQVPLNLPLADTKALMDLAFDGINGALALANIELSEQDVRSTSPVFVEAFQDRLSTPRLVKRYVNSLTFALPLLKDETNYSDVILIEGVRTFYPRVYEAIKDHPEIFLGEHLSDKYRGEEAKKRAQSVFADATTDLDKYQTKAVEVVVQRLFPKTQNVFGRPTIYGSETTFRWAQEKRIASRDFFHRYFSYSVRPDDISDRIIDEFLTAGDENDVDYIVGHIRDLSTGGKVATLVRKLRLREDQLPVGYAKRLALALSQNGALFPQEKENIFSRFVSPHAQVTRLLIRIVQRIQDPKQRDNFAVTIAKSATPLSLAVEYAYQIKRSASDTDSVVSDVCEKEISEIIGARISNDARNGLLFQKSPEDVLTFLLAWSYADENAAKNFVKDHLINNPSDVLIILEDAMTVSYGPYATYKTELSRESYNALKRIIAEPEIVMSALRHVHPDIDSVIEYDKDKLRDAPPSERAAKSFAVHYNHEKDELKIKERETEDIIELS
jgi:hypothetical protein